MISHLDDRLFPSIDYSCRDQIIWDLMDIIKCPIIQYIAQDPIVFNDQFYNRISFDTFHRGENERSARAIASGYNDFARVFFKDPRTGGNFRPNDAMRVLFCGRPTRTNIITVLFKRIENINIEEIKEVLPSYDNSDNEI